MIHNLFARLFAVEKPVSEPSKLAAGFVNIGNVLGQRIAKQGLLIAASGSHNCLMIGPPGEGKSFLASTLPSFMSKLTKREQQRLHKLYQIGGSSYASQYRPMRSVHHSTTPTALIGGYKKDCGIVPGEVSLAHNGILYLDEIAEFDRQKLDLLRQPSEAGRVTVSRLGASKTFPCRFLLLACSNPCPCGYAGSQDCVCSPAKVRRYLSKLSGPFLDRCDIITRIHATNSDDLKSEPLKHQSERFYCHVLRASIAQFKRNGVGIYNSSLQLDKLKQCTDPRALDHVYKHKDTSSRFSSRKLVRCLRVARTIADLKSKEKTQQSDIVQALDFVNFSIVDAYITDR